VTTSDVGLADDALKIFGMIAQAMNIRALTREEISTDLTDDVDLQVERWRILVRGTVAVAFGDQDGFLAGYDELEKLTAGYKTSLRWLLSS
jgi:hypothetical protein